MKKLMIKLSVLKERSFLLGIITGILVLFSYNHPQKVVYAVKAVGSAAISTVKATGTLLKGAFVANTEAATPTLIPQAVAQETHQVIRQAKKEIKATTQAINPTVTKTNEYLAKGKQIAVQAIPKTKISIVSE